VAFKGTCLDEAEIVAHEADDPNAFVDFFDSEALAGKDGRDIDAVAMHAYADAGGDEDLSPHAPRPPRGRLPDVASRYRGMNLG
jgi:hypothetical protein